MTHASGPTMDTWTAVASGNWSAGSNWSLGAAPTKGEAVVIDTASALTVTFDVPTLSVGALTLVDDALDLQSGSLVVTGATALQSATINGVKSLVTDGSTSVEGAAIGGSVDWFNYGAVTQSGGTVAIGDATSSVAEILNEAGATWTISDASGFMQGAAAGSRFINAGTFQKTSGSGVALVQVDFMSSGTIASQGGGDIEFDGKTTSLSGTYIGSGMVDYGPDGVATIGNVNVTASCCQTSWGTVDLVGTMTMNFGSTIANESGAHWNFDGDSSLLLAAGQWGGPNINGTGAISKIKGTGTSVVSIDVETQGLVSVSTGTLAFEGAAMTFSGAIMGAGTFEIAGGEATLEAGAALLVSNWTLAGGVTDLDENITYAHSFTGQSGATLDLGGHILNTTGSTDLSGLTLSGAGSLNVKSATGVSGLTIGGTTRVAVYASVTQSSGATTIGDASASDAAQLVIGAGGSWSLTGGDAIDLGADPSSSLSIVGSASTPGLLAMTGSGISVVEPTTFNNATDTTSVLGGIEVTSGVLDFQGAVYGTGADNIVGGGTLEFDKYLAPGQTINFSGANGTLTVDDLLQFYGQIAGFDTVGSDDAILIGGGWTYGGATEGASSTTLAFSNGASHRSITLNGAYTDAFAVQSLAGGVLKVTY